MTAPDWKRRLGGQRRTPPSRGASYRGESDHDASRTSSLRGSPMRGAAMTQASIDAEISDVCGSGEIKPPIVGRVHFAGDLHGAEGRGGEAAGAVGATLDGERANRRAGHDRVI